MGETGASGDLTGSLSYEELTRPTAPIQLITVQKDIRDGGDIEPPKFEDRTWRKKEQEMGLSGETEVVGGESGEHEEEHVPAHHRFREKYFTSFRKEDESTK